MTADFLLELRCEEIPARMQAGARRDLEKLFREHLAATGVTHGAITVWSTPRRLALIVRDLPPSTEAVREEIKGPRTSAPPQALEGFLRKTGLSQDRLEDRGGTWFAMIEKPGRATAEVLAWAIAAIVRTFPWPKSMRWGAASLSTESIRWVRPLSGIVAILGEELVEFEVGGVQSGTATLGHRFHHPGAITIGGAGDYQEKLRACHVIVDHAEREALIRERAQAAAAGAGLALVADEGLVIENAGLTEWPVPLLGRFDPAYLDVPPEVIQLTARTNQKYFVCTRAPAKVGASGVASDLPEVPASAGTQELANAFVCTANIDATDGGAAIVDGNRKVLAARLADARFFWDQDRRKTMAQHAEKLGNIVFHEKLGTVADKVERVARLARWLVEEGIVKPTTAHVERSRDTSEGISTSLDVSGVGVSELADMAEQAARLCKADLVTEMVGEFPELQGLMGSYYARAEGLPVEVADAIRDHYKPVGQGDDVPTAPVTVAVSLADKLDTLASFFSIRLYPTGSKDPFALRRAALGLMSIILRDGLVVHVGQAIRLGWLENEYDDNGLSLTVMHFLADRLEILLKDWGVRHDYIRASLDWQTSIDGRLDRIEHRARTLKEFFGTPDGADLLAGYKRAANILKKEGYSDDGEGAAPTAPEPAEAALVAALDAAEPEAEQAIAAEDFAAAMTALASLRAPIDAFFEAVMVNDPDPAKRAARLALLDRFRKAVHQVADFSKIEG